MDFPSLRELAKSGCFGSVSFEMTEAEVEERLGKADVTGGGSSEWRDNIWRYGDLEFGFVQPEYELFCIGINFWGEFKIPSQGDELEFDPWIVRGGLPLEEFLSECNLCSIEISEKRDSLNENCREVITEGGMHAFFVTERELENDFLGLTKIVSTKLQIPHWNAN